MPKKGEFDSLFDFFVVGSSTLDIIARTNDVERVDIAGKHVEHLVCISFASKSELEGLELHPGGSGSNSAIMMRAFGSSVYLLSAVGSDLFGKIVLDDLRKNGIGVSPVRIFRNSATGVGLDILSGSGEKSVLVYRGANSLLGSSDVSEAAIRSSKRVFIASLVSGKNYGLFKKVLAFAKKHRRPVVFAPSITMLHRWAAELRKLKPRFDVVIMNYEEGRYYAGKEKVVDILGSLPGRVAIVTKDVDGAYAAETVSRRKKLYHIPAIPVKVADTTGAGDAFSGAFAASYYSSGSLQEALKAATAAAALKLTHRGAHFSMKRNALEAFIRKNSRRLTVRRI